MNNGWVKLHRKLLVNLIFKNEKGLKVWIWCLLKANHKDNLALIGRQKVAVKEGEFIMGSKKASEYLDMAKSTIWFWLEFLEKEKQVELKKTNKFTIVKLKNWNKYQQVGLKSDSNEETDGKQIGTNKNDKNEKNGKEDTAPSAEWDFEKELEKLKTSKRRDLQIISLYWFYKNFNFSNAEKMSAALKRELRPAGQLKGYSDEELVKTMDYLTANTEMKWTLETIHKYIDDLTSYKK